MAGLDLSAVGAVVIGRNEGARLIACLASLDGQVGRCVYVDSGSTDSSCAAARDAGAEVVELDLRQPFTAARARNAGLARLAEGAAPALVQCVDGDCTVQPGWIAAGAQALAERPEVAIVVGHLRERHPERSVYNRLCDLEWTGPTGDIRACGGIFLARCAALQEIGGFDARFTAGEEPELCVRLRRKGWRIHRIDAAMAEHDAAMTRFSQWWRRTRRAGRAYALGAATHGAPPERHYVPELRRALIWGGALPLAILAGLALFGPWAAALALAYPAQILRLWRREGDLAQAAFLTLGKFPETLGAGAFAFDRLRRRSSKPASHK